MSRKQDLPASDFELEPLHVLVPRWLRRELKETAARNERTIAVETRKALDVYLFNDKAQRIKEGKG